MQTRFYGMNGAANPAQGVLAAISYTLYRARDWEKSQVSGEKTWERMTNCIKTAALRAETVSDYVGKLGQLIHAATLPPSLLSWVVQPKPDELVMLQYIPAAGENQATATKPDAALPVTIRASADGSTIQELYDDAKIGLGIYMVLVKDACSRMNIDEYALLDHARGDGAIVIGTLVQIKAWELKQAKIEPAIDFIEVSANA
jgi:hypothetical protein